MKILEIAQSKKNHAWCAVVPVASKQENKAGYQSRHLFDIDPETAALMLKTCKHEVKEDRYFITYVFTPAQ